MTIEETASDRNRENKQLADHILRGDSDNAAQSANELLHNREDVKDVVDTIADTMNIVTDLHEVDRYSSNQVESCERAAEKALEAIRPKIKVEQTKIQGRVMVASLKGDPHSFDRTLLLTMLEIGGFTALDGGADQSPHEVAAKVKQLRPDILAVPLVTRTATENLRETTSLLSPSIPPLHIVSFGRGARELSPNSGLRGVEEDSLGALSRIAELLIAKP